jgi:hypothetical protein
MNYQYRRACKCGNVDYISATKVEVAFDLKENEVAKIPCSKCGSKKGCSMTASLPDIDEELLRIWIRNEDDCFLDQDEELILAQYPENTSLYLSYLDSKQVSDHKKSMLVQVLMVMLYGRTVHKEEMPKDELTLQLIHGLKERIELVSRYNHYGWDYIKKVCYPIIGLEFAENTLKFEDLKSFPQQDKTEQQEVKRTSFWNQLRNRFR